MTADTPSPSEVVEAVAWLRKQAQRASDVHRRMAEDKSLRQDGNHERRTDLYADRHRSARRVAAKIVAALPLSSVEGWQPIETAPVNTPVRVKLGEGMVIVARLVPDASITSDGQTCDQWQAEFENEHPECWSDGCCWESNVDEICSMQPTHWMPLPEPPAALNLPEPLVEGS